MMFLPVPVPTEYSWQQPHPTFRPHEHLLECSTTRSFVVMHGVLVQHRRIAIAFRQAAKFSFSCFCADMPCFWAASHDSPIATNCRIFLTAQFAIKLRRVARQIFVHPFRSVQSCMRMTNEFCSNQSRMQPIRGETTPTPTTNINVLCLAKDVQPNETASKNIEK